MVQLLTGWIFGGLFYLFYGVCLDMYNFVRILKDYKTDEDPESLREAEEEKSDKVIIYNEIIQVIKSLYFMFRQKEREAIKKVTKLQEKALGISTNMNLDDALIKIEENRDEEMENEGYTL